MRFPFPKTNRHWMALSVAAPTLTVLFLVSGFFRWSPLNCWHDDVDINSGRVRHTRFLLYCQIGDRIQETWISRALNNPNGTPEWRRVNTFSPGVHYSPHYQYHGAIAQIRILELAENTIPFEPAARRKVAESVLTIWRNKGSYFDAEDYIDKVAHIALALHGDGASSVKASDVPAR